MANIDQYEARRGQAQGQSRRIGPSGVSQLSYEYREFDVPFDNRLTLYADVALGTLLSGDTTGTCTGVKDNGTTTVTATEPSFAAAVVGENIVIADTGTYAIASRTSTTVIVVTGDATCTAKAFTIADVPALTALYVAKRDLKAHRQRQPDRSTILAYYALPQWYRPDSTQNIRGKVYIDRMMAWERVGFVDEDGDIIRGPTNIDADDLKGYTWRVVKGSLEIQVPRTLYRLVAAATSAWDPATIEDLIGTVNNATALGSDAGKLRFDGTREELTIRYFGSDLRQVQLAFLRNPIGWNNILTVRRYEKILVVGTRHWEDGSGTAPGNKTTLRWRKVDADVSSRKSYSATNFGVFNDMINL